MEEVWKDIYFEDNVNKYDFTRLYMVSNMGNVKSLNYNHTGKEKILSPEKTKKGYLRVQLCKDGKRKQFYIHRLVLHVFDPDGYFEGAEINHIDENKENNSVENLEWVTTKENINHGTRNKRMAKTQSRKVIGYSLTDTKVIILQSTRQAKKFGFDPSTISKACRGKYCGSHVYNGFKWYYLDDYKNSKVKEDE